MFWLCIIVSLLFPFAFCSNKFAYVTVHYEGTKRDAEYVLGIQVLMQSIRLSKTSADLVVLASNTVSLKSKQLFKDMGCKIIEVENIKNPFSETTLKNKGFMFTLNKLHVWNMVQYDSVVYVDADNLLLRNGDEMFDCGPLCAVFMNPCHFHTGLMVVTPRAKEYNRLLLELSRLGSFDGADQGFLSSVYSAKLKSSSLFKLGNSTLAEHGKRLPVGYNINHKYYYEQYHWKLFYLRHFAALTNPSNDVVVESARFIPAITIGFPMAPVLKPWYWYAAFVLDLHWVWHDVRDKIPYQLESFGFSYFQKSAFSAIAIFLLLAITCRVLITLFALQRPVAPYIRYIVQHSKLSYSLGITSVLLSWYTAGKYVHPLIVAKYGFYLFIMVQHMFILLLIAFIGMLSSRANIPTSLLKSETWTSLTLTFFMEHLIVLASRMSIYGNILWKMIVIVLALGVVAHRQAILLRKATGSLLLGKGHSSSFDEEHVA